MAKYTGHRYNDGPVQKLSLSSKNEKWQEENVNYIDNISRASARSFEKEVINYNLYNGKHDPADYSHITNPFGLDYEMPTDLFHYDIVSSKIKILLGEELKRPFNFKVKAVNEDAIKIKQQKMHEAMMQSVSAMIQQELLGEGLIEEQKEEPVPLPEIEKYYTYNYKESHERVAQQLLDYIIKEQQCKFKFSLGYLDALVAGKEFYKISVVQNKPVLTLVNPLFFDYDKSSNIEFIHDAQWAKYEEFLTVGEIIDRYGDSLSEKDIESLDSHSTTNQGGLRGNSEIEVYRQEGPVAFGLDKSYRENGIRVVHVEWKSLKKIGFLTRMENGEPIEEIVDEIYELDKTDESIIDLEWKWVTEVWEGTKIDAEREIILNVRPRPYQYRSEDNPFYSCLSYTGTVYEDRNSEAISLLDRMKPFQYDFNVTMFRINQELARSRGKKIVIDYAQIPKGGEGGWDMDKWLYYSEVLGIVFINSLQTNEKGEKSSFNQFRDMDQGVSSSVNVLFQHLEYLDMRCYKSCGISPQREGDIGPTELATNAERAVVQSSHMTEVYNYRHNELKKVVLGMMLEAAKMAYKEGTVLENITDDMGSIVINITKEFILSDYGLFINNSAKDEEVLKNAKLLAQNGLQSGLLRFSDVLDILSQENIAVIKNKIRKSEMEQQQQQQQEQQMQAEMQEKQLMEQQAEKQAEMALEYEKLRIAEENNIRDNQTKLALMGVNDKSLEVESKLRIEAEKLKRDYELKLKEIESKYKMNKENNQTKEKIAEKQAKAAAVRAKSTTVKK